jgi:hypothetical protein
VTRHRAAWLAVFIACFAGLLVALGRIAGLSWSDVIILAAVFLAGCAALLISGRLK